jgi:glutamine amidotransferase
MSRKRVRIVDYGSGNLHSIHKACEFALAQAGLDGDVAVTGSAAEIKAASHVVLPGVGAFGDCVRGLKSVPGMVSALEDAVHARGVPFLGICVGMQMLASKGFEHGEHEGLGWIKGEVVRLPEEGGLVVPHMGWNEIVPCGAHPILAKLRLPAHAYFVHSYVMRTGEREWVQTETEYGAPFVSTVAKGNMYAVQFHPEKSGRFGVALLQAFLEIE